MASSPEALRARQSHGLLYAVIKPLVKASLQGKAQPPTAAKIDL